ncbi:MAG: hypothetical protein ACQERJ_03985 [Bacillota bacterium]
MTNKQENWEELAEQLGLSKELMAEMGAGQLTAEQLQMLYTIIELHSTDHQALNKLLKDVGLNDVLDELPLVDKQEVNQKNDFSELMQQIENIVAKKDLKSQ